MNKQTYFKNLFHWNQHCSSLVYCLCEYWRQNHWNPRLQTRYDFNERRFLKWKSPFFNFCYSSSRMMTIAHQKSLTVVFFWFLFLFGSRLKRRREAVVFGSLIRDRFKMDLYTCFAHCHRIACWKNFHLSHHFCPGRVPWWPHGTLGMPKKKNVSFIV